MWRISPSAPLGEFVDPDLPVIPLPPVDPDDNAATQQGWSGSSFELLNGVEVSEEDPSTVPAELFDELFKSAKR